MGCIGQAIAVRRRSACTCTITTELRDSINARRLACLPHGAMVVNVARGDLVNEPALFAALNEDRVSGIGFDVYRNEPHIYEPWLDLPNTTLLPHISRATREARTAMGMLVLDGIKSHLNGAGCQPIQSGGLWLIHHQT